MGVSDNAGKIAGKLSSSSEGINELINGVQSASPVQVFIILSIIFLVLFFLWGYMTCEKISIKQMMKLKI